MIRTFAVNGMTSLLALVMTGSLIASTASDDSWAQTTKLASKIGISILTHQACFFFSKIIHSDPCSAAGGISGGWMISLYPQAFGKIALISTIASGGLSCLIEKFGF